MTHLQFECLRYVRERIEVTGVAPSITEIASAIGVRSTSTVAYALDALEARGRIRRLPGMPRAIELLPPEPPRPIEVVVPSGPLSRAELEWCQSHAPRIRDLRQGKLVRWYQPKRGARA